MNLYELAKIATYLNLATLKIKAGGAGSLNWLTDTAATIAFEATAQSQETQCLGFGSTLWIANNEDRDTITQRTFVNRLGIKNAQKLLQHVERYGRRTLTFHAGQLNVGALTMKQRFMRSLVAGVHLDQGNAYVLPAAGVANGTLDISGEGRPAVSAIVFVEGAYEGDGNDALHAEQKLIAALGKLIESGTVPRGEVSVGGVKSACGTCSRVLQATRRRLNELKLGIYLQFENARADRLRTEADLNPDNNDDIRALDIDTYFDAPEAAPAEAAAT
jgi:hypothetical protein